MGQMAVCCQYLPLGAVSSCSVPSVLVGALFKKFGLFFNTPRMSVTLVTQHAMLMRCIILSFVAFLDLPYFSTLSCKRYDFRKIVNEYKNCILIFSTTCA